MPDIERGIRLNEAAEQFILDCRARRLSPQTVTFYRLRLAQFLRWADEQGIHELHQVRPSIVRAFAVAITERDLSVRYQHAIMRALDAFLRFAVADEMLDAAPAVPKPTIPHRDPVVISLTQARTLLRGVTLERDRVLILLLLDTGVRAGEAVAFDVGDLDPVSGALYVRQAKGGKERTVYSGAKLRRALWRYLRKRGDVPPDAPLIAALKPAGARLTVSGVVQIMADARRATGVPVTAHTLRRTFATECLRAGMDLYTLARLMGHSSIATLSHYLAIATIDAANAHERFGLGDRI